MTLRKTVMILGAIGLLSLGASTTALAGGSVFAGVSMPTGDFGDIAKTSYQLGGSYGFPVAPMASVGAWAAYNRFSWDEGIDGNMNSVELLGYGRISAPLGPFGMLGLGVSSSKATISTFETDRETDFTWAIGGGYKMAMLEFTGLYHSIRSEGSAANYFSLTAGIGF